MDTNENMEPPGSSPTEPDCSATTNDRICTGAFVKGTSHVGHLKRLNAASYLLNVDGIEYWDKIQVKHIETLAQAAARIRVTYRRDASAPITATAVKDFVADHDFPDVRKAAEPAVPELIHWAGSAFFIARNILQTAGHIVRQNIMVHGVAFELQEIWFTQDSYASFNISANFVPHHNFHPCILIHCSYNESEYISVFGESPSYSNTDTEACDKRETAYVLLKDLEEQAPPYAERKKVKEMWQRSDVSFLMVTDPRGYCDTYLIPVFNLATNKYVSQDIMWSASETDEEIKVTPSASNDTHSAVLIGYPGNETPESYGHHVIDRFRLKYEDADRMFYGFAQLVASTGSVAIHKPTGFGQHTSPAIRGMSRGFLACKADTSRLSFLGMHLGGAQCSSSNIFLSVDNAEYRAAYNHVMSEDGRALLADTRTRRTRCTIM